MRVVLQVVTKASVEIEGRVFSEIGKGFLLLVGFCEGDTLVTSKKMIDKILSLRLFPDENGKTNLSLDDVKGEILCVSQFTLYGNVKKGRRPSFIDALNAESARELYHETILYLEEQYSGKVAQGIFQADMKVKLVNDGPFTLIINSEDL